MNQKTQAALMKILQKTAADEPIPPAEAAMPTENMEQAAEPMPGNPNAPAEPEVETGDQGAELLEMLVRAYCAEKVSEYQYEQAISVCLGNARNYFLSECDEHRQEEHDHADMLAERIDVLGGVTPLTLEEVAALNPAGSPQETEDNRNTAVLTQQIIEAEQAAVEIYAQIEQMTRDTDPVTNDMVISILATEQEHVVDMTKVAITIGM